MDRQARRPALWVAANERPIAGNTVVAAGAGSGTKAAKDSASARSGARRHGVVVDGPAPQSGIPQPLLHVGFPKAASKYLQAWFAAHPQLGYAHSGLSGFRTVFDLATEAARPSGCRYRVTSCECFVAPNQDYSDVGRAAPTLTFPPDAPAAACAMLRELFPAATVLIVTRGFREILYATYAELIRNGALFSTDDDFFRFIDRHSTAGASPFDFNRVINLYREAFGADQVIVRPYERLREDPAAFIAALEQRLGLDRFEFRPDRIHAGPTPAELYWYPRVTRMVRWLPDRLGWVRPYRRYASALTRDRLRWLARVLPRPRPGAVPGPEAIPESLLERFRGASELLRGLPEYRGLEAEYLLDGAAGT